MKEISQKRYRASERTLKEKLENLIEIIKIFNSNEDDYKKAYQFYNIYTTPEKFRNAYNLINKKGQNDPLFSQYIKYYETIYQILLDYEKRGLFENLKRTKSTEPHLNRYEKAEEVILCYMESNPFYNTYDFLKEMEITKKELDSYLKTLKVLNPKLLEAYKTKKAENIIKRYNKNLYDCMDIANGIRTGKLFDGTPFDILEFWKRIPFKLDDGTRNEFKEYNELNNNIAWGNNCIRRVDNFTRSIIPRDNQTILNYAKSNNLHKANYITENYLIYKHETTTKLRKYIVDETGNKSITSDITLTGDDYNNMIKYIIINEYPLIHEVLQIVEKKYLNGEIDLEELDNQEINNLYTKKLKPTSK